MQTDQRITVAMAELLRRQGYAGTGIKQVIEAAGVPNGSLYHHFPGGKSEIAGVALRTMGDAYAELVGGLLADGDDLPAAIERAFDAAADDIENTGWVNMCPVGTIAGEVADAEPALREVAA
ncbi:TetR/AcrR family transcriptional regulator, partial [Streptomyces sp. SID10244]|nr:TetR/AcrR family transcriptional regulator [Streptomyces sp. SID10244]